MLGIQKKKEKLKDIYQIWANELVKISAEKLLIVYKRW